MQRSGSKGSGTQREQKQSPGKQKVAALRNCNAKQFFGPQQTPFKCCALHWPEAKLIESQSDVEQSPNHNGECPQRKPEIIRNHQKPFIESPLCWSICNFESLQSTLSSCSQHQALHPSFHSIGPFARSNTLHLHFRSAKLERCSLCLTGADAGLSAQRKFCPANHGPANDPSWLAHKGRTKDLSKFGLHSHSGNFKRYEKRTAKNRSNQSIQI